MRKTKKALAVLMTMATYGNGAPTGILINIVEGRRKTPRVQKKTIRKCSVAAAGTTMPSHAAAQTDDMTRPFYPMIIFRTPKGWTCPKFIDGKKTEGSWRAHQVPLASARDTEEHFQVLKNWLESYKPEELFDEKGAVRPEVTAFMPKGELRIGQNPNANGGRIREELRAGQRDGRAARHGRAAGVHQRAGDARAARRRRCGR